MPQAPAHWTANLPDGGAVRIETQAGRISRVTPLGPARPDLPLVSPGFVDLQINGFAGVNFSAEDLAPEDLGRMLPAIWATGCTSFLPTLITNSEAALSRNFRVFEAARDTIPGLAASVPGYHLEGPFISAGASRGTHNPAFMRDPDAELFQRLQVVAGGRILMVTIAPERAGADAFVRAARAAGATVALSHTDGSPADVHRAALAGATFSTHLGNGCPALLHRHEAPFWAQLDRDELAAGIICDGFHLTDEMIRIIHRVKGPGCCALVSDAVHLAGLPPGRYDLVGIPIEAGADGKVVTVEGHSLAGSTLSMDRAVNHFQRVTGVSWAEALHAATRVPANAIRPSGLCTAVRENEPANLVFLRPDSSRGLRVERTMLAGRIVHEAAGL